jgi:DNA polymerase-3 subunit epsilon
VTWPLPPAGAATWGEWDAWRRQALAVDDVDGVLSLREVADRHGGEVWVQRQGEPAGASIRLLLPLAAGQVRLAEPEPAQLPAPTHLPSRPEYYDFDLFGRSGAVHDDRLLSDLVCTVFDTETTGLIPEHDEIVSIGALRIVNGRMLRGEVFEQLIDPRRPVPETSIAVHGITDDMLRGQPTIERVLPRFHHFAADTVLVGHNLAFDLRMFAAKERAAGVRFDGPVLDTLLLSAVVHPQAASHSLEAIAGRLGLPAIGRHTALGDAHLTGEIFLHLLPLLAAQGITTLHAAQAASQATHLARLHY